MTDKRIGKIYSSVINNITKKIKTQNNCMKRVTNNPEHIFMLGNKCIKPDIKSKKRKNYSKSTYKRMKNKRNKKSKRAKYLQRGGGFIPNIQNGVNGLISGIRQVNPPPSVLPWEGNFIRNALHV